LLTVTTADSQLTSVSVFSRGFLVTLDEGTTGTLLLLMMMSVDFEFFDDDVALLLSVARLGLMKP